MKMAYGKIKIKNFVFSKLDIESMFGKIEAFGKVNHDFQLANSRLGGKLYK